MNLHSRRWSDLIFENRNKAYGAYRLRVTSGRRHAFAFIITILALALIYFANKIYEEWSYQHFQNEEDQIMTEQYELLDALIEEKMVAEVNHPKIPRPIDAPDALKSPENPVRSIKNELLEIMDRPAAEINEYLDELVEEQEKKQEKEAKKEEKVDDQLYTTVDVMPSYPGGESGLMAFLAKNLRFPITAEKRKIEKTVTCCFFVEKDGSIKKVDVLSPADAQFDWEAVRVIMLMPKWKPAIKNGKPIRVKYILPINFKLK
jgi:periplasmic protein TonB